MRLGRLLLCDLAETDFPAAAALALDASPSYREVWAGDLGAFRARTHFDDALTWVSALPDDRLKGLVIAKLGFEAMRQQPKRVAQFALQNRQWAGFDLVISSAALWTRESPEDAANWAKRAAIDPALRDRLIASVAAEWSSSDAVSAGNLVLQEMEGGDAQDSALIEIARRWSRKNPRDAASWAIKFPEGPLRDGAIGGVVTSWAKDDSESVSNWISGLVPGEARDAALCAYASELMMQSGELALKWANEIQAPDVRERQIATLKLWAGAPQ